MGVSIDVADVDGSAKVDSDEGACEVADGAILERKVTEEETDATILEEGKIDKRRSKLPSNRARYE